MGILNINAVDLFLDGKNVKVSRLVNFYCQSWLIAVNPSRICICGWLAPTSGFSPSFSTFRRNVELLRVREDIHRGVTEKKNLSEKGRNK
jgi:hypothetical protein